MDYNRTNLFSWAVPCDQRDENEFSWSLAEDSGLLPSKLPSSTPWPTSPREGGYSGITNPASSAMSSEVTTKSEQSTSQCRPQCYLPNDTKLFTVNAVNNIRCRQRRQYIWLYAHCIHVQIWSSDSNALKNTVREILVKISCNYWDKDIYLMVNIWYCHIFNYMYGMQPNRTELNPLFLFAPKKIRTGNKSIIKHVQ